MYGEALHPPLIVWVWGKPPQPFYPQTLNSGSRRSGRGGAQGGGSRRVDNSDRETENNKPNRGQGQGGNANKSASAFGEFYWNIIKYEFNEANAYYNDMEFGILSQYLDL